MKRMLGVLVAAFVVAIPVAALARYGAEQGAKSGAKTLDATGIVTAVANDSLSVKSKTGEVKFTIDKETEVRAKGATHKSLELRAEGKSGRLPDFVKVGDTVNVRYQDTPAKLATNIVVTQQAK